jgi:hypothetical protein
VKAATLFAVGEAGTVGLIPTQAVSLAKGVLQAMLMKKLQITATVLLMVGLIATGAGLTAHRAVAQVPGQKEPLSVPVPAALDEEPRPPAPRSAVFRVTNFRVKAPTLEVAQAVGLAAEYHRKELALLWLGRELPAWREPCPIHVTITGNGFGGATTFEFHEGEVRSQNMNLQGPLEEILSNNLRHEVAHVILAHWSRRPLPRWADEGVAILSESAPSRARHDKAIQAILDGGRRLPLRELFQFRDYPKDVMALYAQGYSVTDFLVRSAGRAKFLAFVAQSEHDGWDQAAKTQYGFRTVEELERVWLDALSKVRRQEWDRLANRSDVLEPDVRRPHPRLTSEQTRTAPQGSLPTGPAPEQVLVEWGKDGRLAIWRKRTAYEAKTSLNGPGQPVTTYYVPAVTLRKDYYDLAEVKVSDGTGKRIDPFVLPKLLKAETPALVSVDGRPVDSLHLRLVREDCLVFVLPIPPPAEPPPAVAIPPRSVEPFVEPPLVPPPVSGDNPEGDGLGFLIGMFR